MIKTLLLAIVLLSAGCVQFRASFGFFPPRDIQEPLGKIAIVPGQTRYEIHFTPRYSILYDVKLNVRHYPLPYHPDINVQATSRLYRGDVLLGICKSAVGPGWWTDQTMGYHFCPMSPREQVSSKEQWTLTPNKYGKELLVPNVPYTLVIDLKGDLHQFHKDFSPASLEVSKSSLNDISM